MIEAGFDVVVNEKHADELLGCLLAMVTCVVVVMRGEKLHCFRVLFREVKERLQPLLLPVSAGPMLSVHKCACLDDTQRSPACQPRPCLPRSRTGCMERGRLEHPGHTSIPRLS